METRVKLVEQYLDYSPPVRVNTTVQLLMSHVPREHLNGLRKVVLTNSTSLLNSHKGKYDFDGDRLRPADLRGFYGNGQICLVVDQILRHYPEAFLLVPMFKTLAIGDILYHELGHHIHRLEKPGYRDNCEAVADEWRDKLLLEFFKKHYWYLAKLLNGYKRFLHPTVIKLIRRSPDSPGNREPAL
jgi:hypothetical protein